MQKFPNRSDIKIKNGKSIGALTLYLLFFLCGAGKLSKKQLPSDKGMTEKMRPLARPGFTRPTPFC